MLPSVLEAVLFDVGGTLVHVDYGCLVELAAAQGIALSAASLQRGEAVARQAIDAEARATGRVTGTDAGRFRGDFGNALRAAGVPAGELALLVDALEREHAERNLWRQPFASAAATLGGLRSRGLRTAAVSNADGRVEAILAGLGLAAQLDLIVDSHLEGVEKPDPEIFRRTLARLGVAPERSVYVGDIYSIDAVGARAAGIAPVIVDPTGSYRKLDCTTIADVGDLLQTLV